MFAEGRVLPDYHCVVIDEAHNLDEVATNAFSHRLSRREVLAYFRVGMQLVSSLQGEIPEYIVQDLRLVLDELIREAGQYFKEIETLIPSYTVPLTEENKMHFARTSLGKHLGDVAELLQECDLEEGELSGLLERFVEYTVQMLDVLHLVLMADDAGYVFWAEMQSGEACLIAAPISIASFLGETLFEQGPPVILTSATLSTDSTFDYIQRQLGLDYASTLILGSPFNYEDQAILCVPAEAKNPNHPRYAHYVSYLILKTAALTKGGVLALFCTG